MTIDISTILNQLSAQVQQRFNEVISNSSLLSAMQALSGAPAHPYERLKYDLFEKDYKFPTIEDIETPNDFDSKTYMCELTSCSHKTQQAALSGLKQEQIQLKSVNLENLTIPTETLKHNLEFIELVRSISLEELQKDPVNLAKKLTSYYIKNYK
jgi:hypothetical protein